MARAHVMSLTSPIFIFLFLPIALAGFWLVGRKLRSPFLLVASLVFVSWGEGRFALVLVASAIVNFLLGNAISRARDTARGRVLMWAAVSVNLAVLGWFKYATFLAETINVALAGLGLPLLHAETGHLPLGISFFTFQAIAYVLDVYRAEVAPERGLVRFTLFTALFPKLAAGPIIRYGDVSSELAEPTASLESLGIGAKRFILGLGKKILIADTLARVADQAFSVPVADLTAGVAWLGLACYTLQIYFDFCGYSDMAVGVGRMFGFTIRENFDHPYVARSLTDFWRRWHMSLSTWLRDYLFVPLSYALMTERVRRRIAQGSYRTNWRAAFAIVVVFGLCGLWHGAGWNFVIWGLLHGLLLAAESLGLTKVLRRWWTPFQHAYLLLAVMLGWVFFRLPTFGAATAFLGALAGRAGGTGVLYHVSLYLNAELWAALATGTVIALVIPKVAAMPAFRERWLRFGWAIESVWLIVVLLLSFAALASQTFVPFLYQRF